MGTEMTELGLMFVSMLVGSATCYIVHYREIKEGRKSIRESPGYFDSTSHQSGKRIFKSKWVENKTRSVSCTRLHGIIDSLCVESNGYKVSFKHLDKFISYRTENGWKIIEDKRSLDDRGKLYIKIKLVDKTLWNNRVVNTNLEEFNNTLIFPDDVDE